MTEPISDQQLDEYEAAIAAYQQHPDIGFACCSAHPAADAGVALVAEVRRLRTEMAAVAAFLDEQELAARAFELPTPAWVKAVRAASAPSVAPVSAVQPSGVSESTQSPTGTPTGALTASGALEPEVPLPDRLEAVLTERFTELGNPYSRMRIQEEGPDGWPTTWDVSPSRVAEVLRELLAATTEDPTPAR
jgi:hypothetical protein